MSRAVSCRWRPRSFPARRKAGAVASLGAKPLVIVTDVGRRCRGRRGRRRVRREPAARGTAVRAGPGGGAASRPAPALRRHRGWLRSREDSGGDEWPRLSFPEGVGILRQLLRVCEVFGCHPLTERSQEPLKVEGQKQLPRRLIRRQLGEHGVHHIRWPPITQLNSSQELGEQSCVGRSVGLQEASLEQLIRIRSGGGDGL